MAEIVLIRHGETEWSAIGRHTSRTEAALTAAGEAQARALGSALEGRTFALVLVSPRERARQTARLAGLQESIVDDDLSEWDYGDFEGLTSAQIHAIDPDWSLWTDGCPGGETPAQVTARLDRVLARAKAVIDGAHGPAGDQSGGDVALVAHGHALRVAAARWVALPAAGGGLLKLDTGTLSALGYEHATQVIQRWNCPP